MSAKKKTDPVVCRNRKAEHNYTIHERIECGIMLLGTEVKSIRARQVSLDEAYARVEGSELWLFGCHIATYAQASWSNHNPLSRRKLLVSTKELRKLQSRVSHPGFTLIPLDFHFNERGIAKVTLGVAEGKGKSDKRESLKLKEHKREMDRAMRHR